MTDKYPKIELLIHELSNTLLTLYFVYFKIDIYICTRRITSIDLLEFINLINIWSGRLKEIGYNVLSPRYFQVLALMSRKIHSCIYKGLDGHLKNEVPILSILDRIIEIGGERTLKIQYYQKKKR